MSTIAQRLILSVLVALPVVLSSAGPAFAAKPPDACGVVTKDEAAKALGVPIVGMKARLLGASSMCTIKGAGAFKAIAVTTYGWSSVPEAQSAFASILSSTAQMGQPSVALHGLGDQAQQIGTNVYVRKGTAAYVFNVIDGSVGPAHDAKSVALAKSVVKHIR